VKTTDIEDKVTSPAGLQDTIDGIVRKYNGKKAFLRPSGT
jgi:phosphoacetylglucosamine mutase